MKECIMYECGVCHRLHKTKEMAEYCEGSHMIPEGVSRYDGGREQNGYPMIVNVFFKNRRKFMYIMAEPERNMLVEEKEHNE